MDENTTLNEQMEEALRYKIEEFSSLDIKSEHLKDSADAIAKVTDSLVKLEQQKDAKVESKKDIFVKILTGIITSGGAFAGVVVGALIKAKADKSITIEQLEYMRDEHVNAYRWEAEGKTENLITSPASRNVLNEKPKLK